MSLDVALFLRDNAKKYKITPAQRIVLTAIGWRIGNNKFSWPSQKTLADECGYTEKHMQKIISQLKKMNIILSDKNISDNRRNTYLLNKEIIKPYKTKEQKCGTISISNDKIMNKNTPPTEGTFNKNTPPTEGAFKKHSLNIYINNKKDKKQREKEIKNKATEIDKNYTYHNGHKKQSFDLNINIDNEHFKFINRHLSKGTKSKNWHAEFSNWLMRASELKINKCGTEARYEKQRQSRNIEFRNPSIEFVEYRNRENNITEVERIRSHESSKRWIRKIRRDLEKRL